ncbi:CDP-alcohol phosphatidyltransferase family protein [Actinoplanes sp. CA-051413]|uniref:CDP-alcohol phosphatidyltransferase family protein n=1 Tax=Actinoplanes sp. CA-051413 TaxID=3239899 RepID=UPI003D96C688
MTLLARREMTLQIHPAGLGAAVQAGVIMSLAATVGLGAIGWATGVAFGVLAWSVLAEGIRRSGARSWGPADTITLVRLALTGGVAALVAEALTGRTMLMTLVGLAAVAAALDAVDGQVARRTKTTSAFGARFDMEADSVLVLILSLFVASSLGWWVAAIGLFRYAFVAASWAWPWLRGSLPPRMVRKVVAALQGAVLVLASADLVPVWQAQIVVALALGFLTWSFGTDVVWLRSRRTLATSGGNL